MELESNYPRASIRIPIRPYPLLHPELNSLPRLGNRKSESEYTKTVKGKGKGNRVEIQIQWISVLTNSPCNHVRSSSLPLSKVSRVPFLSHWLTLPRHQIKPPLTISLPSPFAFPLLGFHTSAQTHSLTLLLM
jgi:hypothetical protein